jgi:hypothetical protein
MPSHWYKQNTAVQEHVCGQIIEQLAEYITIKDQAPLLKSSDALDAAVCCLAGADFLKGLALEPENLEFAKKEGWIWVKGF